MATLIKSIKSFRPDQIFEMVRPCRPRREFVIDGKTYRVRMGSTRLLCLKKSPICVCCGLAGAVMILEQHQQHSQIEDGMAHFNLYGKRNGRLVMLTRDHVVPASLGGGNDLENSQTLCQDCNSLKGNDKISVEMLRDLTKMAEIARRMPTRAARLAYFRKLKKSLYSAEGLVDAIYSSNPNGLDSQLVDNL